MNLLFVCVENSCRSQMAEGWARTIGGERGIRAWSCGASPSGQVNPGAVAAMQEAGVDIAGQSSKGVEALPSDVEFDAVVTMGCGDACPRVPCRRVLDWPVPDPKGGGPEAFARARDEIRRRVQGLIDDLERRRT
ncbi:arsenate reductase ArsC [Candidatus Sumerlaeota bacterium]|nr:arsenate reductase ArsC [Candidatus Sumerlaeota bacterium]